MKSTKPTQSRLLCGVAFACAIFCSQSVAADYLIQIGAYQSPSASSIEVAQSQGTLFSGQTSTGLTRVLIGEYDSREAAESALPDIHEAGFADAFVVSQSSRFQAVDATELLAAASNNASAPAVRQAAVSGVGNDDLSALTESERSRVVYLDGEIRIKVGDAFYTVNEFRELNL